MWKVVVPLGWHDMEQQEVVWKFVILASMQVVIQNHQVVVVFDEEQR